MSLNRRQLATLQDLLDKHQRILVEELRRDASRSGNESFSVLAGPVTDRGDESVADLIADVDHAQTGRDVRELREIEGLNNKAKVTARKAYGLRTFRMTEIALYHALGKLPEAKLAHRFC
jgi:hypothetical protein